jgi:diguanylate cyclase (GGDEF)-like protein
MGSFRLRLVIYFMLLSLLPLAAATWAFSEVAKRGETGNVDARLSTALRVATAEYAEEVEQAEQAARSLARATVVQQAFLDHDRSELLKISHEVPNSAFYFGEARFVGEEPPALSVSRSFEVITEDGQSLGRVVVSVPFDDALAESLRKESGLEATDSLALVAGGKVFAPAGLGSAAVDPVTRPGYVELGGTSFRTVGTELVAREPAITLLALTPKSEIDAAAADVRERFLLFVVSALVAVGLLAWALGRTIVRSLKQLAEAAGDIARGNFDRRVRPDGVDEFARVGHAFNDMAEQLQLRDQELAAERARVRDAGARFGEALAATHDPVALLPVIVESTVEATGAAAGRLVVDGKEIARAGDPETEATALAIPLGSDGAERAILYLTPRGSDFSNEARELAHWLGSQTSIALENARLHRLVERQASTDGLTELANRRHFEEALDAELTRIERFGGGVALVLADLDDFKGVNDQFGHQAGDEVLRAFADILRETVREIDLAARYGGEEFAVLLPQTDLAGAEQLAERLRRAIASRPLSPRPGSLIAVTASFGVAAFPDSPTPASLVAAADKALYRAKRQGKNCVVGADADMAVRVGE